MELQVAAKHPILNTSPRYILLAKSYNNIVQKTNILSFIICVLTTLVSYHFFQELSILSFAFGCFIAFTYNFIHLLFFAINRQELKITELALITEVKLVDVISFIGEGTKVSIIFGLDYIFCAILMFFIFIFNHDYTTVFHITLQFFSLEFIWVIGFSNGILLILPKYKSIFYHRKFFKNIIKYIFKHALFYWMAIILITVTCSNFILDYFFSITLEGKNIAKVNLYFISVLIFFDFIRNALFALLRIFYQTSFAMDISLISFILAILTIFILSLLQYNPLYYIVIHIVTSFVITLMYFQHLFTIKIFREGF